MIQLNYKDEIQQVTAYQIDNKLFATKEECEEYIKEKYLQNFLKKVMREITKSQIDEDYATRELSKYLIAHGEEIKKWL